MIMSQNPGSSSAAPPVETTAAAFNVANATKTNEKDDEYTVKLTDLERQQEEASEKDDFETAQKIEEQMEKIKSNILITCNLLINKLFRKGNTQTACCIRK
jgi:excinuclease UvrABC helicase subunit UvrB